MLDLDSASAVQTASAAILKRAHDSFPEAKITGLLVAQQYPQNIEVILGVQHDPVFGPVIMFGLGGIYVELFKDVSLRAAPIAAEQAHEMIMQTKASQLLTGIRGQTSSDVPALVEALVTLSDFALAHRHVIDSIDINPLLVLPQSQGVVALDAAITLRESQP